MNRIAISLLVLCLSAMVAGAESIALAAGAKDASAPDASAGSRRPCLANFTEEGSFWTGKTYRTFQEFQKIDRDKAFQRVAQQVAADGWQGMNAQKEVGVITATQTVSYGQGKEAPLNVVLKPKDSDGLRIEAVFTTSGGLKVSADDMQKEFCKLLEAAPN